MVGWLVDWSACGLVGKLLGSGDLVDVLAGKSHVGILLWMSDTARHPALNPLFRTVFAFSSVGVFG